MRIKVGIAASLAAVAGVFMAAPASTATGTCPEPITTPGSTVTLTVDGCIPYVQAADVTINLNRHTVPEVLVNGRNTTVRNGTIGGHGIHDYYGDTTNLHLDRVLVKGFGKDASNERGVGVIEVADGLTVTNSRFVDNNIAIDLYWGEASRIVDSTFEHNGRGIANTKESDTVIRGNTFTHNDYGVTLEPEDSSGVDRLTVSANVFRANKVGLDVGDTREFTGAGSDLIASGNWFVGNTEAGLSLRIACADDPSTVCGLRHTLIVGNVAVFNAVGIRATSTNALTGESQLLGLDQITLTRNLVIGGGIDAAGTTDGGGNRVIG